MILRSMSTAASPMMSLLGVVAAGPRQADTQLFFQRMIRVADPSQVSRARPVAQLFEQGEAELIDDGDVSIDDAQPKKS